MEKHIGYPIAAACFLSSALLTTGIFVSLLA